MSIWVVSQKQRLLSHVGQKPFLFLKSRPPAPVPPSAAQNTHIKFWRKTKMKKNMLSRVLTLALAALLALSLFACGKKSDDNSTGSSGAASYQVGICSYADDASLNQIVDNIEARLKAIGQEKGVTFEISYDNCNTDSAVLNQIIANFMADKVDLMIGVATPVAVAMQAATEGTDIPVVFAAVSDPVGAGLVESLEAPGANITGTSDYLDTDAILDLIFAADPDAKSIALLYDLGQDSSAAPIKNAKAYLDKRGVSYKEYNGTTTDEISLAVSSIVADKADAVFTPTDNTVMTAELAIYEALAKAGIPHYTGADSFVRNGAYATCGVNYTDLGAKTADLAYSAITDGMDGMEDYYLMDGGIITVNTDTAAAMSLDYSCFDSMGTVVEVTTTKD